MRCRQQFHSTLHAMHANTKPNAHTGVCSDSTHTNTTHCSLEQCETRVVLRNHIPGQTSILLIRAQATAHLTANPVQKHLHKGMRDQPCAVTRTCIPFSSNKHSRPTPKPTPTKLKGPAGVIPRASCSSRQAPRQPPYTRSLHTQMQPPSQHQLPASQIHTHCIAC